jgi:CheY-like chemotaxis protein
LTRVLICDDNHTAVTGLATLLEMDGFEVVALTSPVEALRRLEAQPFDVLITDLEMPELNGLEVIRRARELVRGLPVLLLTAYVHSPASEQALARGALAVLAKPLDYDALLQRLAALGAPGQPSPASPPPESRR